mmetsp:Transcript_26596/g.37053  ORF Transcript_26596/g.37053 Transcript_26596/m.37053 type:complete len:199 (+) Transcript_26596:138-734(+)
MENFADFSHVDPTIFQFFLGTRDESKLGKFSVGDYVSIHNEDIEPPVGYVSYKEHFEEIRGREAKIICFEGMCIANVLISDHVYAINFKRIKAHTLNRWFRDIVTTLPNVVIDIMVSYINPLCKRHKWQMAPLDMGICYIPIKNISPSSRNAFENAPPETEFGETRQQRSEKYKEFEKRDPNKKRRWQHPRYAGYEFT